MPWHDPIVTLSRDGQSLALDGHVPVDPGYLLKYGVTGIDIAPVTHETVPIPAGHGSLLRHTRLGEREIFLPICIFGRTWEECDQLRDDLRTLVDPTKGELTLSVTSRTRAGETRWIKAIYAEGLSGDYGESHTGYTHDLGLKFKAVDAFWSKDEEARMWRLAPGVKPFLSETVPFFPIILTSGAIGGEFDITVEGDQPVWPIWTVSGPGTDLTIEADGKRIRFEGDLKAEQMVTIDTAAGDVYDAENTDGQLWSRVSLDTDFFQLNPGQNHVKVTLTGANEMSQLTMSYNPQYLTGY